MVCASRAIVTVTLALSAAAPILAVPVNGGNGHVVRASPGEDLELGPLAGADIDHPPDSESAPQAAPPAPATKPSFLTSTAAKVLGGIVIAGAVGGATYGIIKGAQSAHAPNPSFAGSISTRRGEVGGPWIEPHTEKDNHVIVSVAQDK